jgi:hypothetical protein
MTTAAATVTELKIMIAAKELHPRVPTMQGSTGGGGGGAAGHDSEQSTQLHGQVSSCDMRMTCSESERELRDGNLRTLNGSLHVAV